MSGDAGDFNNIESRAVMIYFPSKPSMDIYAILRETLGEQAPSYDVIKNWMA
jgi:hypothetical protein